ncbi:MAG: trypsin-like peptidase domain-containing protein [Firmicutes bacterium]|jgi:S1-C subfamily serine protease|nr:trypsin-like peptidase domain-containing protein [Bacillota bacterium]MCL5066415.1 trypsin-like peptidase domain-containing protein [Bacillota bacterium]
MHPVLKTASAAIVGFAVGAGAATGLYTAVNRTQDRTEAHAQAGPANAAARYAKIAVPTASTLPIGADTISQVVARTSSAVVKVVATVPQQVSISSSSFFTPFFGSVFGGGAAIPSEQEVATDIGSGFFFNSEGYLLTNDHVIQGASSLTVDVPGYHHPVAATVVGTDYAADLAVLRVRLKNPAPVLALGNSTDTPVGSWAIAIGNPYNLNHTVTVGVISAKGRPLTIGNRQYRNLLQTSAAINPGNSGGPLLNLQGEVVGINTAVQSQGQGISFAIPTSTIEQVLPRLMKDHDVPQPWIGIYAATDSAKIAREYDLASQRGVLIAEVDPGSPAAAANLSAGDVITAVNGVSVRTASRLQAIVHRSSVGTKLILSVNHNGSETKVAVIVGENPNSGGLSPSLAG